MSLMHRSLPHANFSKFLFAMKALFLKFIAHREYLSISIGIEAWLELNISKKSTLVNIDAENSLDTSLAPIAGPLANCARPCFTLIFGKSFFYFLFLFLENTVFVEKFYVQ